MSDTTTAFHPMTMGVMYPCFVVKAHGNKTSTVRFFVDGKKYRIPDNHISLNGGPLDD